MVERAISTAMTTTTKATKIKRGKNYATKKDSRTPTANARL